MAKILIADDVMAFRDLAGKVLAARGHTVLTAENGQQALELIGSQRPDLVVADVSMPLLGGLDLLRQVRSQAGPQGKDLPVIIVSAAGGPNVVAEAAQLGAFDFMLKSRFTLKEFAAVIERALGCISAPADAKRASSSSVAATA